MSMNCVMFLINQVRMNVDTYMYMGGGNTWKEGCLALDFVNGHILTAEIAQPFLVLIPLEMKLCPWNT